MSREAFCPRCGGSLIQRYVEGRERQVCSRCGRIHYKNAKPCACALVIQDGRVLLVRRAIEPFYGYWDIPGGFLEADEHPAAGVVREMEEETGLRIRLTALLGIYVDTYGAEDEYTLNIHYLAEVVSGEPHPASDALELAWFAPHELPSDLAFRSDYQALEDWQRAMRGELTPMALTSGNPAGHPGSGEAA
ncbi:MAG: NUDIX domain-containing protein [Anaerolineae bacterium]